MHDCIVLSKELKPREAFSPVFPNGLHLHEYIPFYLFESILIHHIRVS